MTIFVILVIFSVINFVTPEPLPNGRIVGGYPGNIADFPYQLSLRINDEHMCGASVIATRWALTASHCVERKSAYEVSFRAGSSYYYMSGKIIYASSIYMHPYYNPSDTDYDAAVVSTLSDFTGENIKPIRLPTYDQTSVPGKYATASGWGYISATSNIMPSVLQYTELRIISHSECDRKLAYAGGITETMFCAAAYKTDTCQGDSGGPLVMDNVQIGVVSWGLGCADSRFPGVYTNLAHYSIKSWIKRITGV